MSIELDDVQSGVLIGHRLGFGAHVGFRVADRAAARRLLGAVAPAVRSTAPWGAERPAWLLNVALSHRGLARAGLDAATLAAFGAVFAGGMAARAGHLRDPDPGGWEPGLRPGDLDVLVWVAAATAAERDRRRDALVALAGPGVTATLRLDTALLDGRREHFGFADGLSQPRIDDPVAGPAARPGQEAVAPGEFLLGHRDEDGDVPGPAWGRNGTFVVVRKLEQDVARWRAAVARWGAGDPERAALLAAKAVGRWPDGTPVAVRASAREPPVADPAGLNDFGYADDPRGRRCPVGAHVRRAHPRDALHGDPRLTRRHRMIRRGMPYGAPLGSGPGPRGLLFACFVASLERQFELVQREWLGDGDAFGLGDDADLLLGPADPDGKLVVPGDPPDVLAPNEPFVTLRGGEYLFVPGLRALRALAS